MSHGLIYKLVISVLLTTLDRVDEIVFFVLFEDRINLKRDIITIACSHLCVGPSLCQFFVFA